MLLMITGIQGWRWQIIAHICNIQYRLRDAVELCFIGTFFNQMLLSSIGGDAVRVYRLYRNGFSISKSFNSILLDRIMAVFALVLLSIIGFTILGWSTMPMELSGILLAIVVLALAGLVVLLFADRIPLPHSISHLRLISSLIQISADARHLLLSPVEIIKVSVASIIVQIAASTAFWLLGYYVGLNVDFFMCIAIFPLAMTLTILPISVAGWGVREGAIVMAFNLVGGNSAEALITSILFGLATAIAALPGTIFWFKSSRNHDRSLKEHNSPHYP